MNSTDTHPAKTYRGRFAPSPSGELHFGSLVTALASYLDAKSNNGLWLVRVEDIDPPREKAGASESILSTLETYGLHWDQDVLYQSQQSQYYQDILSQLAKNSQSYACQCSRAQIKALGGIYQRQCRHLSLPLTNNAIRVINQQPISDFNDLIQGKVTVDKELAGEDFIVKRKDGLFAYQLAVVADDIYQNISHVIRGCDLIEPTVRQLSFYQILTEQAPLFGHVPLAVTEQGYKLSKQNNALALDNSQPIPSIIAALTFLGLPIQPEHRDATIEELIHWAVKNWSLSQVPQHQNITIEKQSAYPPHQFQ